MREVFFRSSITIMAVGFVWLAMPVTPSSGQAKDQGHEICQPHGGRCLTIKPPNLPPAPANWKMPRTREGKPDFTGVYGGAGFNHQVGPNDTDTPIIRGFDGKVIVPISKGKLDFGPWQQVYYAEFDGQRRKR